MYQTTDLTLWKEPQLKVVPSHPGHILIQEHLSFDNIISTFDELNSEFLVKRKVQ